MSTRDLIDAIASGSYTDAEDAFANVMNQKVGAAIDDMQVAVAKSMFQTEEEVDTTIEAEEEVVAEDVPEEEIVSEAKDEDEDEEDESDEESDEDDEEDEEEK